MKELIVLLPAYNEEENVAKLVGNWQSYQEKLKNEFQLILKIAVINDGSKDQTKAICEKLGEQYDNFILLNHPKNKGLGEAVKTGINYVTQNENCEYACLMDCDNTHDPKFVLLMLNEAENADVVIASRYQKGATIQGVAKYRLLFSEGAKYIYSAILRVKNVKDYTCGYRLYNRAILKKAQEQYQDSLIEESGFTCMAELLYKLSRVGARFAEVPFELRYDLKNGDSKMKVLKTAFNSVKLAIHLKMSHKG